MTLFEALTGGVFVRLNWQHSGEFDQNFSKKSNAPGVCPGEAWTVLELTGTLTSDLREAISKISEVCRLLAPLIMTSSTFEELSTSSHESPQVNSPTVNSEVKDPQSIALSRHVNHELQRLFPTLRRSNEQASPLGVTKTQTP